MRSPTAKRTADYAAYAGSSSNTTTQRHARSTLRREELRAVSCALARALLASAVPFQAIFLHGASVLSGHAPSHANSHSYVP